MTPNMRKIGILLLLALLVLAASLYFTSADNEVAIQGPTAAERDAILNDMPPAQREQAEALLNAVQAGAEERAGEASRQEN